MTDFANMFLDTNIILDVIENRDKDVKHFVNKLIKRHKKGVIQLSTSIYNITELLDIAFEISFYLECMKEKLSCDFIIKRRNNRGFFYCERAIRNKDKTIKKINDFLKRSELEIYTSPLPIEEGDILRARRQKRHKPTPKTHTPQTQITEPNNPPHHKTTRNSEHPQTLMTTYRS